jgi:uncharacterized protein YndB with AHSA1/START domain
MTSTRIKASLRRDGAGTATVRVEDRYDTSVEDLWSALTEVDRLRRWIADVEGDLRVGGEFRARFTSGWEGPGRVEICDRPSQLRLALDPGQAGATEIEATLRADGAHTVLVIEERGLPAAEVAGHGAGWQAHIEDLAAHLAGRDASDWRSRWIDLLPAYQQHSIETGPAATR